MNESKSIDVVVTPGQHALVLQLKALIDKGVAALGQRAFASASEMFEAARRLAPVGHSAMDVATHNAMTAYKQWITQLLENAEFDAAQPLLQRAFDLRLDGPLSQDLAFRKKFADGYYDLNKAFYRSRVWDVSLACVRRAIEIAPDPSYYVDLTNALAFTKGRARLQDYVSSLRPELLGRHLFVACAPKSGSTYLKNLLIDTTKFRDVFSVYAGLQNEQELDLPQLARFATIDTVTQQHCRASEANVHLMQAFGIRPVVLVRNIFDTLMSLRDFYDNGFVYSTFFEREHYIALSPEEKIDLLIEYVLPWYFQFLASWQRAAREQRIDVHWLTYEDLTTDPTTALSRVLSFYGIQVRLEDLRRIVNQRSTDRRGNRFNQGISGRGLTGLSESQKGRISSLAKYFPSTDFSAFGF